MTKQEKRYANEFFHSTNTDILDCYARPSENKLQAQRQCRDKMHKQGGFWFRILSYNTCFFTCGWLTNDDTLHIETPSKSITIANITTRYYGQ